MRATKNLHVGCCLNKYLNVKLRKEKMNQINEIVNRMTNVEMNDVAKTILIKRLEDSERDLHMYESLVDSIKKEIVAINHIIYTGRFK